MDKNQVIKNLINKTIEIEYRKLDKDTTGLEKFENYSELSNEFVELEEKIYKTIPEKYRGLVMELIEMTSVLSGVEQIYAFKQGVIKGLTDLSYLNDDIGIEVAFI